MPDGEQMARSRQPTREASLAAICVALSALALGCGDEASLRVQLWTAAGDTPFVGLETLEVTVSSDGAVLESERVAWDGRAIALSPVRRVSGMEVVVLGLLAGDVPQSQGVAKPDEPARGGTCCIGLCFCTDALAKSGGCTCGDGTCHDPCLPPP